MKTRLHLLIAVILCVALTVPAYANILPSDAAIDPDNSGETIRMTTEAAQIEAGNTIKVDVAFGEKTPSNTIMLDLKYDGSLFSFSSFSAAKGVNILSTKSTYGSVELTLMVPDYEAVKLGTFFIASRKTAKFTGKEETITMNAEYVLKDNDDEKTIMSTTSTVNVTTKGQEGGGDDDLKGDTNTDGVIDLIDLSNIMDWFGITNAHEDWAGKYIKFDFNKSADIDIYDIAFIAKML